MKKFNVTYEIVTPESAENGEAEESGFICKQVSLSEAVSIVGGTATEASSSPLYPGSWFINCEYGENYRTGERESRSIHPPRNTTRSSLRRIARLLGVKVR